MRNGQTPGVAGPSCAVCKTLCPAKAGTANTQLNFAMTHYTHNLKICRFSAFAMGALALLVVAGGSFGVVYLRKSVATTAQSTRAIHAEITQAERKSAAQEARIARAHSPQELIAEAPAGLRPTQADQIVWIPRAQPLTPVDYVDPALPLPAPAAPINQTPTAVADAPAPAAQNEQPLSISFALP
ncbi:hypothetical protein [Cerasicoccus maritimus]|uniref:hypothetical protein n=1 Tax=Cerasicoccus maritimus TaxID=490089 RepID=UPI002852B805|nr:hypothetical protein [Cerasicoccus maritimus]